MISYNRYFYFKFTLMNRGTYPLLFDSFVLLVLAACARYKLLEYLTLDQLCEKKIMMKQIGWGC